MADTLNTTLRPPLADGKAAPPSVAQIDQPNLDDETFRLLRDFIYERSGIYFADSKKYVLQNRLAGRIRACRLKDFKEYYYYLKFGQGRFTEITALFDLITTNETCFYRNKPQLQVFQLEILPRIVEARSASRRLRMWSAACSTGEEPYTLAIIAMEVLKEDAGQWRVEIIANDIRAAAFTAAKKGLYNEYTMRNVPPEIRQRYFTRQGALYRVNDELRRLTQFRVMNLIDDAAMKRMVGFDVIFCRNVLIYFDQAVKKKVVDALYDALSRDGILFVGHSESLHDLTRSLVPLYHPGSFAYAKC